MFDNFFEAPPIKAIRVRYRKRSPRKLKPANDLYNGGGENLLGILARLHVSEGFQTVLLTFLAALTIAPYLGGRAIWVLGGEPVLIPTLSDLAFWFLVIGTPYFWVLTLGRVFAASKTYLLLSGLGASAVAAVSIGVNLLLPSIGLTAMHSSFGQDIELEAWYLTAASNGSNYTYFRTKELDLNLPEGCALRIDGIGLSAGGWAIISGHEAGFDLHVYVSTSDILKPTFEEHRSGNNSAMVSDSLVVREEPPLAEVKGRAVFRLTKEYISSREGRIRLNIEYDFNRGEAIISPEEYAKKRLERRDIVVKRGGRARLQLVGWTLYGDVVELVINDPVIRVSGKLHCSVTSLIRKAILV